MAVVLQSNFFHHYCSTDRQRMLLNELVMIAIIACSNRDNGFRGGRGSPFPHIYFSCSAAYSKYPCSFSLINLKCLLPVFDLFPTPATGASATPMATTTSCDHDLTSIHECSFRAKFITCRQKYFNFGKKSTWTSRTERPAVLIFVISWLIVVKNCFKSFWKSKLF